MDGITTSINSILKNLIKNFNTLLDCPVRYAGEYDGQKVHNFIEYIESYKRIKCITDEQALQELQFLLIDQAHAWWLRRISHFTTWSEALTFLENHYSKQRPSHLIYKEVFKHNFDDYKIKDDFIDDKNELLDELTQPKLSEQNKLEVIYALLPSEIHTQIKFENIINLKDLKKQLQKLGCAKETVNLSNDQNSIVNTPSTEVDVLNDALNTNEQSNDGQHQDIYTAAADGTVTNTNLDTNGRDPIIKVRRTEDLMPHVKDEEEHQIAQQDEFMANDVEQTNNNNTSHISNEHFQIDSDIMNQINKIIDETEMNALHHNNQQIHTNIPGPPDSSSAKKKPQQKPPESQRKSTQKNRKSHHCSYCGRFRHTAQTCLKKAKQKKQFPEKFMNSKANKTSSNSQISVNVDIVEPVVMSNNNINATSTASTEPSMNTSSLQNTLTHNTSSIASVPAVSSIFSIIPDKCINPSLTTKLIAPINGPVPNKLMAAKLRYTNGHMPKCHQCGTVGFYKSICPNCSPIYNNNNNNQYK